MSPEVCFLKVCRFPTAALDKSTPILPRGTPEIEEGYIPKGTYSIAFSKVN